MASKGILFPNISVMTQLLIISLAVLRLKCVGYIGLNSTSVRFSLSTHTHISRSLLITIQGQLVNMQPYSLGLVKYLSSFSHCASLSWFQVSSSFRLILSIINVERVPPFPGLFCSLLLQSYEKILTFATIFRGLYRYNMAIYR